MLVIVDYGVGNLGSMGNMLRKIGCPAIISADPADVLAADRLILPGVGAFDQGIESLRSRGLADALTKQVMERGTPLLGVCLGMQLLGRGSEEGSLAGLGFIGVKTVRFSNRVDDAPLRVPHMGWNVVRPQKDDLLFHGLETQNRFYFVHSYHVDCPDPDLVLGLTPYGGEFVSVLRQGNVWGVQFHPEKSHRFGMQLLKNFAGLA
jgi:imidazole glycerol-phosphate synthase subunit HisH